ncbi:MAG: hypothetical protein OEZ06_15665 [Myxococcales bacterium]|nr:hypothetical protein [Myxococcales bacterium]
MHRLPHVRAFAFAVVLLSATVASAQDPGAPVARRPDEPAESPAEARVRVALHDASCARVPYDRVRLRSLLRVELTVLGAELEPAAPAAATVTAGAEPPLATVVVELPDCEDGGDRIALQVLDTLTHKRALRELDLTDVAVDSRERALAIAVVELLRASWAELLLERDRPADYELSEALRQRLVERLRPKTDAVEPPPTRDRAVAFEAAAQARRQHARSHQLAAVLNTRVFPSRGGALLGPALSLSRWLFEGARLDLGAELGVGSADDPLGEVSMGLLAGRVGMSAAVGSSLQLRLGPQLIAGLGWGSGTPRDPTVAGQSQKALVAALCLRSELTVRLSPSLWLLTSLELGHTLLGLELQADGRRAAGLDAVMLGLQAGMALSL